MTILFADVVGSTELAEELDPESLHRVMTRYFEEMQAVLARHGGLTEKYIGDAILAVFGVRQAHEDDALRAVRAAAEMRDHLRSLNEALTEEHGVRILTRTGINTGEVVTGDPEVGAPFIMGDAVNMAARLEQAAGPGEILISDSTQRLIHGFSTAEPLAPLPLKGKPEPVAAWRILDVAPGTGRWTPRFDSPLVGRADELATLRASFDLVFESRSCACMTVLGTAGVGKSRLTAEFLATVGEDVSVLQGRCLPYGEGITFWPIVEVLRDATRLDEFDPPEKAVPALGALLPADDQSALVVEHLAALMGSSTATPDIHETFWSVRRLLEEVGWRQPAIVVLDDIHWGEATFLDLVEYLREWLPTVPLLFICLARPELLDLRPGWMDGSSILHLEPLSRPDTSQLVRNLLGETAMPVDVAERIADTTEGNPLFVEETLRMLVDDGTLRREEGGWIAGELSEVSIPPTIQALLTARVDLLEEGERDVLERAAVIGRVFWWSAVSELTAETERPLVGGRLQSLVHKQLIAPDRRASEGEDAFRFTHILVRDAAYHGIPKAKRAAFHERFARWILSKDMAPTEAEEIAGYHLEQAYLTLSEIGPAGDRVRELGKRAAQPLAAAGRRAFARGDMSAAANLLARTVSLLPVGEQAANDVLPDLAEALLQTGDFDGARVALDRLRHAAERSDDDVLAARAIVIDLWLRLFTEPEGWAGDVEREARHAMSMFEDRADERGLSKGWTLLALSHMMQGRFAAAAGAWEQAADHATAAGDHREELEHLSWIPIAVWCGPGTVSESIDRCHRVLQRAGEDRKATAVALATIGILEAMRGRFHEARSTVNRGKAILEELHLPGWMGALRQLSGWVELLAGDPRAAEDELRTGVELLHGIGELAWLSSTAAILAEALYAQERLDEAERFTRESESAAGSEDIYSQALLRSVRAKVLSRRGEADEAERVAREAITIAERSDFAFLRAVVLMALGEVLEVAGRGEQARAVFSDAVAVCDDIGFVVGAARASISGHG